MAAFTFLYLGAYCSLKLFCAPVKKRKGNHRFVMATLPSLASIPSSSANNVELHSTFISASSGGQSFTPDSE
jgi:hypothetical protein